MIARQMRSVENLTTDHINGTSLLFNCQELAPLSAESVCTSNRLGPPIL